MMVGLIRVKKGRQERACPAIGQLAPTGKKRRIDPERFCVVGKSERRSVSFLQTRWHKDKGKHHAFDLEGLYHHT
eukprot:1150473-Pelagomonas_calceolata.AAC.2